jgi:hypothetical protein
MLAPRPAAGPALAFFELLLGPVNAALPGLLLLGILDPADEFVARQGRDVLPGSQCRGVGGQRLAQVRGQLVHHPAGHLLAAHGSQPSVLAVPAVSVVTSGQRSMWLLSAKATKISEPPFLHYALTLHQFRFRSSRSLRPRGELVTSPLRNIAILTFRLLDGRK